MLCPRCEKGDVVAARIKATSEQIFVDQECEATWLSREEISSKQSLDFGTYIEEFGLKP